MAKTRGKAKPVAKAKKATKKSGGAPANRLLILLTCAALVPFSLPTLLLLFVGMMPTLVAVVVEKGANRYAWVCVGGLNFSGLAPWLFKLWFGHHTLVFAIEQIMGVSMLLVAFGASACGWLLYIGLPPIVQAFMSVTAHRRIDVLSSMRDRLVEQWGEGIGAATVAAEKRDLNGDDRA